MVSAVTRVGLLFRWPGRRARWEVVVVDVMAVVTVDVTVV
jgi:hypothetical protein